MSVFRIANRYASALMGLAVERKNLDQFAEDVEFINNTLMHSKELRLFLSNPVIKKPVKLEVFKELLKSRKNTDLVEFVEFLISKNREEVLPQIVKRFLEMRDTKLGIIRGEVTCAVELTSAQQSSLKKEMESYTKQKVELMFKVDQRIIGGFVVKAGDTVIDASITNQLKQLRKKFSEQI
jgi:F-type H+-transporting ATPase subunit delta